MRKSISIFDKVKKQMLKSESILSPLACRSENAIRLYNEDDDIRLNFEHDIDRIMHSLSYTRYIDKTQVYHLVDDDQISKRITHVQFVSRAARTIARALGLNEDLCEAISLGHDIGHVPFGHEGEYILDEISRKELGQVFAHNVQSVRNLMYIEKNGYGLNLTVQTLDGILCHNGEFVSHEYRPKNKNKEYFMDEFSGCYEDIRNIEKLRPMTLEGCVVRISDIIGYIGKDIEDAIRLGNFNRENIPQEISNVLGNTNVDIMNNIILDIIENSFEKDYISMSDDVYAAIKSLKKFNYENIYSKSTTNDEREYIKKVFNDLFYYYLNALDNNIYDSDIYTVFLNSMCKEYIENNSNKRKVIDYIAGMTDNYILSMHEKNIKER